MKAIDVAEVSPEIAVVDADGAWSFSEVDRYADAIAALVSQSCPPGSFVAFMLGRSRWVLPTMLGIWRAGCGYLPLDPTLPLDRLDAMLLDSGALTLLTLRDNDVAPRLGAAPPIHCLDIDIDESARSDLHPRAADAAAYIIYTSGSTGVPKGVVVPHKALSNVVYAMAALVGADKDICALAVTRWSFDIAAIELFVPLVSGGRVVIADEQTITDGARVSALCASSGVNLVQTTPSLWRIWYATNMSLSRTTRVLCGGEALLLPLAERLAMDFDAAWNVYGPTETTVWSSAARILPPFITLGAPLWNTTFIVRDDGTLAIGGLGVATGYHDRPALTAERFIDDPVHGRLFLTGDRVESTAHGLVYLGRADTQVKLNGHRLELGEVEALAQRCEGVVQAVCILRTPHEEDAHLELFFAGSASEEAVRAALQAALPRAAWPRAVSRRERLPLNASGKIDRNAITSA